MQVDPEVVQEVAAEVVLRLVCDGDIRVSPLRVSVVERSVATVMREALLREDTLSRIARHGRDLGDHGFDAKVRRYVQLLRDTLRGAPRGSGRGFLSVVESIIALLRHHPFVDRVHADDDALLRKILSVIARPARRKKRSADSGGGTVPPAGAAPAGGLPAEVRAWEVRRGEQPPEPDPERRERPGRQRAPRRIAELIGNPVR
jgi:hypothetical protein